MKTVNHLPERTMDPRKPILIASCALALIIPRTPEANCGTRPRVFHVRQEDSNIGFSIYKWMVIKEEGGFRQFKGTILFNPGDFSATEVELTVYTASIDSRNEGRDRALRSEDFFYVSNHPTMSFKSVSARAIDTRSFTIEGDITIRGITKRISVPVKLLGVQDAGRELGLLAGFEATFVLNREDFGLGAGWAIIGKEATIHILIGANSPQTANAR